MRSRIACCRCWANLTKRRRSSAAGGSVAAGKSPRHKPPVKGAKMTSETYYPDQRHLLSKTTIRRERFLPDTTVGEVPVQSGTRVSVRDVVARGPSPSPFVLVEAAR